MIYISPVITQYKPSATLEPSAPSDWVVQSQNMPMRSSPMTCTQVSGFPLGPPSTHGNLHDEMRCHKCLRFITTRNPHFTTNDDHLFTCPVHQKRKLHPFDRLPVSYSSSSHFSISCSFLSCGVHCPGQCLMKMHPSMQLEWTARSN